MHDYFRIQRVTELTIASDGEWLAYAVEVPSLTDNRNTRHIYLRSLAADAKAICPQELTDARGLAWIPYRHQLAFLSDRSGQTQVFSYDPSTGKVEQVTDSDEPVIRFCFAPTGSGFAYTTQATFDPSSTLFDQFQDGESGILIDTGSISKNCFINPDWERQDRPRWAPTSEVLWLNVDGSCASSIAIPGDVKDYFWSSDAHLMSVTYVAEDLPPTLLRSYRTSVGILDVGRRCFRTLAKAYPRSGEQPGEWFQGGEFIPNEQKMMLRRVTEQDPWISKSYPELAVVDVSRPLKEQKPSWRTVSQYDWDGGPRFFPIAADEALVEDTINAVRSLYALSPSGVETSAVVAGRRGSNSLIQFSADLNTAAFVNESLTQPPEVYLRRGKEPVRQLTDLNASVADRTLPNASEVSWTGTDGTTIRGWLLEPTTSHETPPWPLITFVHGGPGFAFSNAFAPYFDLWPYPFEVYAAHGIAVFFPNYRGTQTYGRTIASPKRIDGEPVDDVVTGVEHLVESGVADPDRLGISGHSHGAWLGPLIMTRAKTFCAGSFAEASGNIVTQYVLMSRSLNVEVHDLIYGTSLYDSPQRYLELSPDLHFMGIRTATLFEAGAQYAAIAMSSYPKAAQYAGIPTEYIIYPKTGHNLKIPQLRKECAERNLDWFRFWLKDEEDPVPAKTNQYARWREMRADSEAR